VPSYQKGGAVKMIDDIQKAPKFWSIRLAILSAALSALEIALPAFSQVVPQGVFAGLSALVGVAAAVARTIKQEALHDDV
jgi:hypothetical protein